MYFEKGVLHARALQAEKVLSVEQQPVGQG
jgi:hypothetical protein